MDTCHYCCDVVDKLNNEYQQLSKQYDSVFNVIDKITKKRNYKECLQYIKKLRNANLQCIDDAINDYQNGDTRIEQYNSLEEVYNKYGDNYKALLFSVKSFDKQEKQFMDEGLYSEEEDD